MIDKTTIQRILDTASITEVVSDFVTLRKRGVNFVGLCPFHPDTKPSFYVSPSKNICKCFACGEGGSPVHFVMKHEQLTYFDALRYLAKKYNIELHERTLTAQELKEQGNRESMFIVNEWAQLYFTEMLTKHTEGRSIGLRYFEERGFREETIKKFELGYSLNQRDALYQTAIQKGYKKEFLEKTGLIISYDAHRVNDRYRGRVIFPIHSLSGKIVGFGGRILKKNEKTAKYVNSPESDIYHKSQELYGLYFAKQAIVKEDRCFLVEGYTDVISMHQSGIENVVASSGTALTIGQIKMIHRFTKNVTVLYDGDAAGIKAALRGIDMLLKDDMNIKVLLLPEGEDPDSFARSHNAEAFNQFIKANETDFIRFKTKLLLNEANDDPIKKAQLIVDIVETIAVIPNDITRSVYIQECANSLQIEESVLLNEVNKQHALQSSTTYHRPTKQPTPSIEKQKEALALAEAKEDPTKDHSPQPEKPAYEPLSPFKIYERILLRYVIRYGDQVLYKETDPKTQEEKAICTAEYIKLDLKEDGLKFETSLYQQILDEAAELCHQEGFKTSTYFVNHPNPQVSELAVNLVTDKYFLSKYHTRFHTIENEDNHLIHFVTQDLLAFKQAIIAHQIKRTLADIKDAQKDNDNKKLMEKINKLTELNAIKNILCKDLGERIITKL